MPTVAGRESREWQGQAELLAHGSPAHLSFPGNLFALVINQKRGKIFLNTLKIKFVEFYRFFW